MDKRDYEPLSRRPLKSRDKHWASASARLLVEFGISPNSISIAGLLAGVLAAAAFFCTSLTEGIEQRAMWLCGAALCQLRLLCNLFDGMVAVAQKSASPVGELFNEVPDRVSDAAIFIGLGYAAGGQPALGYLSALISVFVAYVRVMSKCVGAPNDFCGPMAKPQRMAIVTALGVYLAVAPRAWEFSFGEVRLVLATVCVGGLVTAIRRLARAATHLKAPPHGTV
jgi:phosphatidylglycerophosphate synthase